MIIQSDLKLLRKKHKLLQKDIALMLDCTTRMYQRYESLQSVMPKSLLELLHCKLYHKNKTKHDNKKMLSFRLQRKNTLQKLVCKTLQKT